MDKTALIVGGHGQDGKLLTSLLLKKRVNVIATGRHKTDWGKYSFSHHLQITDRPMVEEHIKTIAPDYVYYLAGHHSSSDTKNPTSNEPKHSAAYTSHVDGLLNCLHSIANSSPKTKLFYASSSLVFSGRYGVTQNEKTPLDPICEYGITKAMGMWLCRLYRTSYNVFASCGILYNHESALRPPHFLTARVIREAREVAAGCRRRIIIGSLDARVDWGYAADYMKAAESIINLNESDDFIIASSKTYSVRRFVSLVLQHFNIPWIGTVVEDPRILHRQPIERCGDSTKLFSRTGIDLRSPLETLVSKLIRDHLDIEPA